MKLSIKGFVFVELLRLLLSPGTHIKVSSPWLTLCLCSLLNSNWGPLKGAPTEVNSQAVFTPYFKENSREGEREGRCGEEQRER